MYNNDISFDKYHRTSNVIIYGKKNLQNEQKFKRKNYQKNPRIHAVSKTRLTFSNSKIAYKNTLNIFFVFFSNKYVKKKKKLNMDHF